MPAANFYLQGQALLLCLMEVEGVVVFGASCNVAMAGGLIAAVLDVSHWAAIAEADADAGRRVELLATSHRPGAQFCLVAHLGRQHGRIACAFWHPSTQRHGLKARATEKERAVRHRLACRCQRRSKYRLKTPEWALPEMVVLRTNLMCSCIHSSYTGEICVFFVVFPDTR